MEHHQQAEFRRGHVRVFPDENGLARGAAAAMADVIARAVVSRGRCALALSGGSTPRALYGVLASGFRALVPWTQVDLFWGDERYVPASHPDSNYGMAKTELLDHVDCPPANIRPIPTDLPTPGEAAQAYAARLRAYFGDGLPHFDLLLLGIGEDGHVASLFPHTAALDVDDRAVAATEAPDGGGPRITLTLPVLLAAHTTFVLATGARKAGAIARALAPETTVAACPAAALREAVGRVVWWLDREAAKTLEGSEKSSHEEHGDTETRRTRDE